MTLLENFNKHKRININPSQTLPKNQRENTQPFLTLPAGDEALIPKTDKDTRGSYRPTSPINVAAKILNKIVVNKIQRHIKRIIQYNQVGLIPGT